MNVADKLNQLEKMLISQAKDLADIKLMFNECIETQKLQVENLKNMGNLIKNTKMPEPMPMPTVEETPTVPTVEETHELTEFEKLKKLLHSSDWPAAVNSDLICDISSEQDKLDRAEGIIDLIIDVNLANKKFLDFGCGEGHVVNKTLEQNPKTSLGYDIVKSDRWGKWPNPSLLTTNWDEIKNNGPYDIILIYDVLDHILNESPVNALRKVKEVSAPGCKIYARCHPWCSRHATHLYRKLNKAFLHLVFTDEELDSMGLTERINARKIIHPLVTYHSWFSEAGINMAHEQVIQKNVEDAFFSQPLIANRIKPHWKDSHLEEALRTGTKMPIYQMQQEFVDYVLTV